LYNVTLHLSKAISDEQNTRGRKICAPEDTSRGFGVLTSKQIPQVLCMCDVAPKALTVGKGIKFERKMIFEIFMPFD
jgi:hypothetical protein